MCIEVMLILFYCYSLCAGVPVFLSCGVCRQIIDKVNAKTMSWTLYLRWEHTFASLSACSSDRRWTSAASASILWRNSLSSLSFSARCSSAFEWHSSTSRACSNSAASWSSASCLACVRSSSSRSRSKSWFWRSRCDLDRHSSVSTFSNCHTHACTLT